MSDRAAFLRALCTETRQSPGPLTAVWSEWLSEALDLLDAERTKGAALMEAADRMAEAIESSAEPVSARVDVALERWSALRGRPADGGGEG